MKNIIQIILFVIVSTASIAYAGGVFIYEPKNGAKWTAGKTYTIKWRYESEPSNPLIELYDAYTHSKKGTIATPSNSDYSSCGTNMYCQDWKIPSNMNQCVRKIKVSIGNPYGYSETFIIKIKPKLKKRPKELIQLNN